MNALTATSDGTLYAGGGFNNLENIPAADNVAYLPEGGTWQPMGSGGAAPATARWTPRPRPRRQRDRRVRRHRGIDVAGIAKADHVVRWNGSAWSAMGSNTAGTNGWFPAGTNIYGLTTLDSKVFATGTFQNANGDPRADHIAWFDGANWRPLGSNGAGNGPWVGEGSALKVVGRQLYAAGNFTSAGGDPLAQSAASFSLPQIIAYPTPTVTPGPTAAPTPTVTPSPTPKPADTTPPKTRLRRAQINSVKRKATFRFVSGEAGSRFQCKLDTQKYKSCTSPKTYKRLTPGKHVFRVKARDRAGNADRTPSIKRFRVKRH